MTATSRVAPALFVRTMSVDMHVFAKPDSKCTQALRVELLSVLISMSVPSKISVNAMRNVAIIKEVTVASVPTGTRETSVWTSTNATVLLSVMTRPVVGTLTEATHVAVKKVTMGTASHVYAVNVRTLSVPIIRDVYRLQLKNANAKTVFNSTMILLVSTLTSVKRIFATNNLNVPIRLEVIRAQPRL